MRVGAFCEGGFRWLQRLQRVGALQRTNPVFAQRVLKVPGACVNVRSATGSKS